MSNIQLHADCTLNAMEDAKLKPSDIDGVATAGESPVAIAHYLGITPHWVDGTAVGGCSFMIHVRHAAAVEGAAAARFSTWCRRRQLQKRRWLAGMKPCFTASLEGAMEGILKVTSSSANQERSTARRNMAARGLAIAAADLVAAWFTS
jgi:hypothetical protein